MHQQAITHEQLQAAIELAGLELGAAEVHGMVCGELCRQLKLGPATDFLELLGVTQAASGAQGALLGLVEELGAQSHASLDAGMQFGLLLPDGEEPLAARTTALADWAHGFALALLRGEHLKIEQLAGDGAEVVRDLLRISEAQPGAGGEEDERALAELEEYIRVGVQLVFEELAPPTQSHGDGDDN